MRIGILTSVETRHRYFVQALRKRLDVVAVVYEDTGYAPAEADTADLTAAEAKIVADHFAERTHQETIFFGGRSEFVDDSRSCSSRRIAPGLLNTTDTVDSLRTAGVDTVVVYGTNLIKPPLMGSCPGRMVNMHLGLSPYYRGTATNFYPLLNEEPEYVGATIHLLDAGIDSGSILAHARPEIVAEDMPHTIGCKAILAGIAKLIAVLRDLDLDHVVAVAQWEVPNAHLCLRKDYHARQVVELYRKIDAGLIPRYVERAARVAGRVRLIDGVHPSSTPVAPIFPDAHRD